MEGNRFPAVTLSLNGAEKRLFELLASSSGMSVSAFVYAVVQKHHFDELRSFLREQGILPYPTLVDWLPSGTDCVLWDHYLDNPFCYLADEPVEDDPPAARSPARQGLTAIGVKGAAGLLSKAFCACELNANTTTIEDAGQWLNAKGWRIPKGFLEAALTRGRTMAYLANLEVK